MPVFCCDEFRRELVRKHGSLNGIDFLEVVDQEATSAEERQRLLRVFFVKPPVPPLRTRLQNLTRANVRIDGGVRTKGVGVDGVTLNGDILEVHVTPRGDHSPYTLHLVEMTGATLAGLDPQLAAVTFSFKVDCQGDFDCRPHRDCPSAPRREPEIDYLAKDYASFRRLMLDRLAVLLPQWQERNAADLGIALVELLAYVGDLLSYEQDAVATEAYLGTARRRVSIRRHARLVDYGLHEGCNARVWVQVRVQNGSLTLPRGTRLATRGQTADPPPLLPDQAALDPAVRAGAEVFETMHDISLFPAHNRLSFYTWGDQRCCLPVGSRRATLKGRFPELRDRDVLIFEEVVSPRTGQSQDADPRHRHAVRLTRVTPAQDVVDTPTKDDPSPPPVDVTQIEWADADALPFVLCLSARTDALHESKYLDEVSVALGNIVLADHGRTVNENLKQAVPKDVRRPGPPSAEDRCAEPQPVVTRQRFQPALEQLPLTHAAFLSKTTGDKDGTRQRLTFDPAAPAASVFRWEIEQVLPAVALTDSVGRQWRPRRDLLSSTAFAPDFTVEVTDDGRATLRFGNGSQGLRPVAETKFTARYRVGNGTRGNVGAGAIVFIGGNLDRDGNLIANLDRVEAVRNPLPARGGVDPESLEHARRSAPSAFRVPQRAVTPADYAEIAGRQPDVQRAAATVRWTGSWRTVFLTVDRLGGREVDPGFKKTMRGHIERFRMAGHDVEIDGPRFVPLEIELVVCVDPDYFRSDVVAALMGVLGNTTLPEGRRALFHPDNFTFGQPVYLSQVFAAAQAVAGVRHVEVTYFQRLGLDDTSGLTAGHLAMGPLEIARLDNDPNFPDRGVLRLKPKGGR
jgi:hypothetical protein